jgi:hypothetical protein
MEIIKAAWPAPSQNAAGFSSPSGSTITALQHGGKAGLEFSVRYPRTPVPRRRRRRPRHETLPSGNLHISSCISLSRAFGGLIVASPQRRANQPSEGPLSLRSPTPQIPSPAAAPVTGTLPYRKCAHTRVYVCARACVRHYGLAPSPPLAAQTYFVFPFVEAARLIFINSDGTFYLTRLGARRALRRLQFGCPGRRTRASAYRRSLA